MLWAKVIPSEARYQPRPIMLRPPQPTEERFVFGHPTRHTSPRNRHRTSAELRCVEMQAVGHRNAQGGAKPPQLNMAEETETQEKKEEKKPNIVSGLTLLNCMAAVMGCTDKALDTVRYGRRRKKKHDDKQIKVVGRKCDAFHCRYNTKRVCTHGGTPTGSPCKYFEDRREWV